MHRLKKLRRLYAMDVTASLLGSEEHRSVRNAFASVPRERFLGKGPWKILTSHGYETTASDDPACIYHDVLVALDTERGIHNGEPSLHAYCLAELSVEPGEHVVHIGAGTGYYTAILARLVGSEGRVTAYEVDPRLAARAARNLRRYAQIEIHTASANDAALPDNDLVYVSAGVTRPPRRWLHSLVEGGRLLLPLTGESGRGAMLLVSRWQDERYAARFVCPAGFVAYEGFRDPALARQLDDAFANGDLWRVRSLRFDNNPDESCWFAAPGWWLSTTPIV